MVVTRNFQKGETIPIWAETRIWATGAYSSPDQGIKITLTDPDGTLAADASGNIENRAMAESESGKWVFYYTSKAADTVGWWEAKCIAQDGLLTEAKYTVAFGGFTLG